MSCNCITLHELVGGTGIQFVYHTMYVPVSINSSNYE